MDFRKIPMLQDLYEITADGEHFRRVSTCKELKISKGANYGYSSVVVTINKRYPEEDALRSHPKAHIVGKHKDGTPSHQLTLKVHQLVYDAWVGPVPCGMVIDHIDRNKSNNAVSNLRAVPVGFNANNKGEAKPYDFGCRLLDTNTKKYLVFTTKESAIRYVADVTGRSYRTCFNALYGTGEYRNFQMFRLERKVNRDGLTRNAAREKVIELRKELIEKHDVFSRDLTSYYEDLNIEFVRIAFSEWQATAISLLKSIAKLEKFISEED